MKHLALPLALLACREEPKPLPAAAAPVAQVVREEVSVGGDVRLYAGSIADLDGDGTLELAAGGFATTPSRRRATVFVYRQAGDQWKLVADGGWLGGGGGGGSTVRNVEVADLDGDGTPEVIALGRVGPKTKEASARLVVLSLQNGVLVERAKAEWNAATYTHGFGLAVGDLDGDGRPEIATAGFLFDGTTEHGFVRTWSFAQDKLAMRAEARLPGTPEKSTRINDAVIADLDGDGTVEIATAGRFGPYLAHNGDLDARREHGDLAIFDAKTLALRVRHEWLEGQSLRLRALAVADLDHDRKPEIVTGGQFDGTGKPCLAVFAYRDGKVALRAQAVGEGAGEIKDVVISGERIIATGPSGAKPQREGELSTWKLVEGSLVRERELISHNADGETRSRAAVVAPDGSVLTIGHAKTSASMIGQLLSWPVATR